MRPGRVTLMVDVTPAALLSGRMSAGEWVMLLAVAGWAVPVVSMSGMSGVSPPVVARGSPVTSGRTWPRP